jgi:hypothetical protein
MVSGAISEPLRSPTRSCRNVRRRSPEPPISRLLRFEPRRGGKPGKGKAIIPNERFRDVGRKSLKSPQNEIKAFR